MKISIVIVEGAKQIMLTPETKHEKECLKIINPQDKLEVVSRRGSFTDENKFVHSKLQVSMCEGGYLRAFNSEDSLMFLIRDKN
jgi:hypothetical protein